MNLLNKWKWMNENQCYNLWIYEWMNEFMNEFINKLI